MNPLDWARVDSGAAGRTPDPDQVHSAIARGVSRGYARFRRRLAVRWLVAVTLVAAITAAAFAVRSEVHRPTESGPAQGTDGSVSPPTAAVPVVRSVHPASGPMA